MFTFLAYLSGLATAAIYGRLRKEIHAYIEKKEKQLKDALIK